MFVGMGDGSFPPRLPLPRYSPSPSLPQEAKEGEGVGGAGLPLGTAVAQSISPKPRNFLLPKRKKKKKNPSGHLSSLPHWDSRDWICGVSREGGSGLEHSQARVVEFPVRPSARPTLGFSPLPPLLPLQANHQRWPSPDLWPPSTLSSAPLPQSWAFPSTSCCGDFCSPPQKSVPSSPTPSQVEGGADPRAGRGEGTAGQMGSWAPRGPPGLLVSEQGRQAFSIMGEPLSESTAPLAVPLPSPLLPIIGINLGTS